MSRMIRDVLGASVLSAMAFAGYAADASPLPMPPAPTTEERDELIVTYPGTDNAHVRMELRYVNAAVGEKGFSAAGERVIATDYGDITVRIELQVSQDGAERLTVTDWPAELWPQPFSIDVLDGDEGTIAFVLPMM